MSLLSKATRILQLGGIAEAISGLSNQAYRAPRNIIVGVDPRNYPTVSQPIKPMGPEGSQPLVNYFQYGANLNYTPRSDSIYTAADLQSLSMFPLARICIDNTKDTLCQMEWKIELKQKAGETEGDVTSRRRRAGKGDPNISKISKFFERPNPEDDWSEWMRKTLEDMLVTDSASTYVARKRNGSVDSLWWTPGNYISRYLDDGGRTPRPPSPAYAQLWEGIPRVELTRDQLIYKPRNIVPRIGILSSYLYGCSPVETIADELKTGISRLMYVLAYYQEGSVGNMIHVAPPEVTADKIQQAVQIVNAQLAGQFGKRRQYMVLQGFREGDKQEQIEFPKEPVLADAFDDLLIRKIAFTFGNSPQRLQKSMNRGSAQVSQQSAQQEGIRPWVNWTKRYMDTIIQVHMGMEDYEATLVPYFESDLTKKGKLDQGDVHEGIRTRDEVRVDRGLDPLSGDNKLMGQPTITTANGVVELGELVTSGKGSGDGSPTVTPKPNSKVRLIERGHIQ